MNGIAGVGITLMLVIDRFKRNVVCLLVFGFAGVSSGALVVNIGEPNIFGQKAILRMEIQNTYSIPIESARMVVFLIDKNGKVVGQEARWVLNGTKDKPALDPNAKITYNFVVQSQKPFSETKEIVTKVVLSDGNLGDLNKGVMIRAEGK